MYLKKSYSIGFLLCFLLSCSQEEQRQAILQAQIQGKIEDFKSKKWDEYRQKEMETAIEKADSILLMNADLWQIPMDSLKARPPKAVKPGVPAIKIVVDSTPVKPLFPIK
jgi:hypothetical protein